MSVSVKRNYQAQFSNTSSLSLDSTLNKTKAKLRCEQNKMRSEYICVLMILLPVLVATTTTTVPDLCQLHPCSCSENDHDSGSIKIVQLVRFSISI